MRRRGVVVTLLSLFRCVCGGVGVGVSACMPCDRRWHVWHALAEAQAQAVARLGAAGPGLEAAEALCQLTQR